MADVETLCEVDPSGNSQFIGKCLGVSMKSFCQSKGFG